MTRGVVVLTFVAFLMVAEVFSPSPGTAQGAACDLGFALTSGGVPEADLNGDGLTCEVTSVDPGTGLLTKFHRLHHPSLGSRLRDVHLSSLALN